MGSQFKRGQLAKHAGVTVRTLHHYDEVGLLTPSARASGGHRVYDERDAERLARIVMLRAMGLSLGEIKAALGDERHGVMALLSRHLDHARHALDEQARLVERLEHLHGILAERSAPTTEDLVDLMEVMIMVEDHYTPEQLEQLRERYEAIGEDEIQRVQDEWATVFEGYQELLDEGAPPDDPRALALAKRSNELIEMFTGGDPGIAASLSAMYSSEGGPHVLGQHGYGMDEELWAFMGRSKQALDPSE